MIKPAYGASIALIQSLIDDNNASIQYWEKGQPDPEAGKRNITALQDLNAGHEQRIEGIKARAAESNHNLVDDLQELVKDIREWLVIAGELLPKHIREWFEKILKAAEKILENF